MANVNRSTTRDSHPLKQDFKNFLWKVWQSTLEVNPTALQYDFADYLQQSTALHGMGDRKILMAFRGAAKSWVTTPFAVWLLFRDRTEQVLVTSATSGFANGIANFAWKMVSQFDWLEEMKPGPERRHSAIAFDVNGAPVQKDESFAAVGIMGQATGRRATRIIGDDLETPNTSDTEGARQQLRDRVAEFGGAIIKPGGSIYLLGTAQTEDTMYREYADEKGYELRLYPVYYPTISEDPKKDERAKYGPRLAPLIADALAKNPHLSGTSTEPTRFSEMDILQRRQEFGAIEFDRQFKMFMDAGAGRGNPIKMRDLVVIEGITPPSGNAPSVLLPGTIEFSPSPDTRLDIAVDALTGDSIVYGPQKAADWVPAEEVIAFIDTSGSGTDETSCTVAAGLLGRVFVCEQQGWVEGHSAETLQGIAKLLKKWRATTAKIEKNFGGGMFGELLQPYLQDIGHPCTVEELNAGTTSKEKRITQTLEPLTTSHRLVFAADVLRADYSAADSYDHIEAAKRRYYRLTYQLSRMTSTKGCVVHDDRADSLTGAAGHFVGVLLRQLQRDEDNGRTRAIEVEVEKMIALRKAQGLPLFGLDKQTIVLGRPTPRQPTGRR